GDRVRAAGRVCADAAFRRVRRVLCRSGGAGGPGVPPGGVRAARAARWRRSGGGVRVAAPCRGRRRGAGPGRGRPDQRRGRGRVEWAWERLDTATARWCFDRLPAPEADHNWLRNRHDEWQDSGLSWEGYCRSWAAEEGLHSGEEIVRELDDRFDTQFLGYGPYFFPDLAGVSEGEEQAAINAGEIQANRITYVGRWPVAAGEF